LAAADIAVLIRQDPERAFRRQDAALARGDADFPREMLLFSALSMA